MSTVNQAPLDHSTPEVTAETTVTPAVSPLAVMALPVGVVQASRPVFDWWMHHWMDVQHPLVRLQRAWVESVLETIEVEAEFLNACTLLNAKAWSCLADPRSLANSASLQSCYHEVAKDMADAHMTRLGKVAELPEDFKQRLWEEMC
ncbi:hypothetical protein [Halomonas aquatica]|uniref:Phasin protein n=1 Tax=Halomonas aquatica TaxID=3151123 RepID=A0ABV1NC29_9GAMM